MRLFSLLGTPITAHPLLCGLLLVVALAGRMREALVAVGVLLTHELGHLIVAKAIRVELGEVTLWPFGGVARGGDQPPDPFSEAVLAAAGPLANAVLLSMAGLGNAAGLLNPGTFRFFVQVDLGMMAINLAPALPLDGGRIGRAFLSARLGSRSATLVLCRAGTWVGAGLTAAGLVGVMAGRPVLGLVGAGCLVLVASLLEREGMPYRRYGALFRRRAELRSGAVLRGQTLVTLADRTVGQVLASFEPHTFQIVAVLDRGDLRRLGELTEAQLLAALETAGPAVTLATIMAGPPPAGTPPRSPPATGQPQTIPRPVATSPAAAGVRARSSSKAPGTRLGDGKKGQSWL